MIYGLGLKHQVLEQKLFEVVIGREALAQGHSKQLHNGGSGPVKVVSLKEVLAQDR